MFCKRLGHVLALPLHVIFKTILNDGVHPKVWKMARITSVYKRNGSRVLLVNYISVSMTYVFSTLLIAKCVYSHFKDNSIFSARQHGLIHQE